MEHCPGERRANAAASLHEVAGGASTTPHHTPQWPHTPTYSHLLRCPRGAFPRHCRWSGAGWVEAWTVRAGVLVTSLHRWTMGARTHHWTAGVGCVCCVQCPVVLPRRSAAAWAGAESGGERFPVGCGCPTWGTGQRALPRSREGKARNAAHPTPTPQHASFN